MDRSVMRNGVRVELTTKEFALLEYLMHARGRVCPRSELLKDVWQASPSAGTNVVDVYVNYLRKKLGAARVEGTADFSGPDRVIDTVRGEGYVMVDAAEKMAPERIVVTETMPGTWGIRSLASA
jgi:DNA-binding response OmpR family regulator